MRSVPDGALLVLLLVILILFIFILLGCLSFFT